jgi:lipid-binding SYLF domain-containing protein
MQPIGIPPSTAGIAEVSIGGGFMAGIPVAGAHIHCNLDRSEHPHDTAQSI